MLGTGRFPCNTWRKIRRYPALRSIDRESNHLQHPQRGEGDKITGVTRLPRQATIVTRSRPITRATVAHEPHDPV